MSLKESIEEYCKVNMDHYTGQKGSALAGWFFDALLDENPPFGEQCRRIKEAREHIHNLEFCQACDNRIREIGAYLKQHPDAGGGGKGCHSGVTKNKDWPPGKEYAFLRFDPAREVSAELVDAVEDMIRAVARRNFFRCHDYTVCDLRQGLGYYRPDEDATRFRRTVCWMGDNNALHEWIDAMQTGRQPLIKPQGRNGCWETAASMFVDRNGSAFTFQRLQRGYRKNEEIKRWFRSVVPRTPDASLFAHAIQ